MNSLPALVSLLLLLLAEQQLADATGCGSGAAGHRNRFNYGRRQAGQAQNQEQQFSRELADLGLAGDCGKAWQLSARARRRLLGSYDALEGQFPAELYIRPVKCGAVLISKRHALTAASCLKRKEFNIAESIVNLGHVKLPKFPKLRNYSIESACISEKFPSDPFYNIAVIKITPPVDYDQDKEHYFYPACLPPVPLERGQRVSAVGYGATSRDVTTDDFLYPANLRVLDSKLSDLDRSHPAQLTMEPLATPGTACDRDEGGGIFAWHEQRQVVHGIITEHDDLCQANSYQAADVNFLLEEIKSLVRACK